MNIVIDAGVILKGYFLDETGHEDAQLIMKDYAEGIVTFHAPQLIMYELVNALVVAGNRKRLGNDKIKEIVEEIDEMEINLIQISDPSSLFDVSIRFGSSAYDAAYIWAAERLNMKMVTSDARLYNSAKDKTPQIVWIEDYRRLSRKK